MYMYRKCPPQVKENHLVECDVHVQHTEWRLLQLSLGVTVSTSQRHCVDDHVVACVVRYVHARDVDHLTSQAVPYEIGALGSAVSTDDTINSIQ